MTEIENEHWLRQEKGYIRGIWWNRDRDNVPAPREDNYKGKGKGSASSSAVQPTAALRGVPILAPRATTNKLIMPMAVPVTAPAATPMPVDALAAMQAEVADMTARLTRSEQENEVLREQLQRSGPQTHRTCVIEKS